MGKDIFLRGFKIFDIASILAENEAEIKALRVKILTY